MKFGKKNSFKTYLYSWPVTVLLGIITVLLFMSAYERFGVERDMSSRRVTAEAELIRLQERKIQLEDRVQHLEGERGIEEEIRTNFDVAREGEQVIILVGEESAAEAAIEEVIVTYPWYQFWR
jgi:cell division protein FtsB